MAEMGLRQPPGRTRNYMSRVVINSITEGSTPRALAPPPRQLAHWEIDIYLPYCTFEDEDAVERKADTVSKVFDPPAECSWRQRAHCRLDDVASHVRQQLYVE